ncbi:MAG: hypothetical protein QOC93_2866 [Actinomycetota bacterium]|nr:hypothetical protein [Actinomycetota bacterium]
MRRPLAALAVFALLAAGGIFAVITLRGGSIPFVHDTCRVFVGERTVRLDPEQAGHAATIAAVAHRRDLPERAVTVAFATALQESKLRNLTGGDRDSVGLFQQRPSQGWGTPAQLRDTRYAARQFYRHLVKVDGWETLPVAVAAQAVQRSAEGRAYEKWAGDAAALARAFTGGAPGAVTCRLRKDGGTVAPAEEDLGSALAADVGTVSSSRPGGASASRRVTVPVGAAAGGATDPGWRVAYWFVAQARTYGVHTVRYGALEWTASSGKWRQPVENGSSRRVVAELGGA